MRSLFVGMSAAVCAAVAYAGSGSYTWPDDTRGGLRFEGGIYEVTQTSDAISNEGTMTITNATVDAWAEDADRVAFANGISGTVNIDAGGVLRVYSCMNDGVVNLNPGGTLVLEKFTKPSSGSGRINANGGRIVFRNVSKPSTYCWFENYADYPPGWCINVLDGGLVISNVVGNADGHMPPIKSGTASDGGVTYEGVGTISLHDNNHTFKGGVHVRKSGVFRPYGDNCFGDIPENARENIFWYGSASMLGVIDIDRNRSISIAPNTAFVGGSTASLRILGTISGDKSTAVKASSSWAGSLVLSSGEGRTNRVGRLQADGRLVIESGMTVVNAEPPSGNVDSAKSVVGIAGNGSYSDVKGVFEVKGGEFRSEGTLYVPVRDYGQLIVSGGVCDFSVNSQEILNGYSTPGRTIVKDGGELRCHTFRLSQCNIGNNGGEIPTQLWLGTNGVVKCRAFTVASAVAGGSRACRVDFDGGIMKGLGASNVADFLGSGSASNEENWRCVPVYVHEGGAAFDSNGYNIGLHLPLQSVAANDGGLTKIGEGTLTVSKANAYNGPTRVLGGTIAFTDASGFPGGDIEVAADMLAARSASSACITVPSLSFNNGAKIRLLVPRGFDIKKYRRWKTVVTSAAAIGGTLPSAEVVDAETGEVLHYEVRLAVSENGRSLLAKPVMGLVITVF